MTVEIPHPENNGGEPIPEKIQLGQNWNPFSEEDARRFHEELLLEPLEPGRAKYKVSRPFELVGIGVGRVEFGALDYEDDARVIHRRADTSDDSGFQISPSPASISIGINNVNPTEDVDIFCTLKAEPVTLKAENITVVYENMGRDHASFIRWIEAESDDDIPKDEEGKQYEMFPLDLSEITIRFDRANPEE